MNTLSFKKELKMALNSIKGISFTITRHKEPKGVVFEIKFNYDDLKDAEDNWTDRVDDALKSLYSEWGGSFYRDCNVFYYSIDDK